MCLPIINGEMSLENKMNEPELENKIWYRAVKTIYILVYILVVIVILLWGYFSKPYQIIDVQTSKIICNKGTSQNAPGYQQASGTILNPSSSDVIYEDGTLNNNSDLEARKLCGDPADWAGWETAGNGAIPFPKNYSVQVAHKASGSWTTPLQIWIIGFGIIFVLFEAVRRIFLYIVIGKKFF